MRRILIAALAAWAVSTADAQNSDTARYSFPVRNVAGLYAANFGEIRTGHFHAGVDIKTDGAEGKPLVAVADGYIQRVVVTTYGYGRAVYLKLADGSTAVYGHLQRFTPELADCVQAERRRKQSNEVDLWFPAGRWPVRKGDIVGYSGNSGSSGGPHLHFELREAGTERRLNTVRMGILRPEDTLPPRILRIHYVEVDTVQEVCVRSRPASYNVVRETEGHYRLTRQEPVPVGRRGYFIIEVSDRRNAVNNTFGIWRLSGSMDGEPFFEYRMDGFLSDQARCSDAVSWYAQQRSSRNEVIRMARLSGAPADFYPVLHEQGLVRTETGRTHTIRIEVEDDCGNRSTLSFPVRGKAAEFRAEPDSTALILRHDRSNPVAFGKVLTARIPAGALYENAYCHPDTLPRPTADTGLVVLSPAVRMLDAGVPLHKDATVTLHAEIPRPLQLRTVLASYTPGKPLSCIGGTCTGNTVTARTRKTGWYVAVADTLAPQIRPQFAAGADLSRAESLRFTVTDNFSGVASATLYIDGAWVPCDRLPMHNRIFHRFDTPPQHRRHRVRFTATDATGNTAAWEGEFYH